MLLSSTPDSFIKSSQDVPSVSISMSERIALRNRKREETAFKYINCDFILGSVAENRAPLVVGEECVDRQQEEHDSSAIQNCAVFEIELWLLEWVLCERGDEQV